jgi:hypothetical protein
MMKKTWSSKGHLTTHQHLGRGVAHEERDQAFPILNWLCSNALSTFTNSFHKYGFKFLKKYIDGPPLVRKSVHRGRASLLSLRKRSS